MLNPLKTFGAAIHAWQEEGGVATPGREASSGSLKDRATRGFEACRRANLGMPPRVVAETRNGLVRALEEGRATLVQAAPGCRFIVENASPGQAYVTMDAGPSVHDIKSIFGPFAI